MTDFMALSQLLIRVTAYTQYSIQKLIVDSYISDKSVLGCLLQSVHYTYPMRSRAPQSKHTLCGSENKKLVSNNMYTLSHTRAHVLTLRQRLNSEAYINRRDSRTECSAASACKELYKTQRVLGTLTRSQCVSTNDRAQRTLRSNDVRERAARRVRVCVCTYVKGCTERN